MGKLKDGVKSVWDIPEVVSRPRPEPKLKWTGCKLGKLSSGFYDLQHDLQHSGNERQKQLCNSGAVFINPWKWEWAAAETSDEREEILKRVRESQRGYTRAF